MLLLTINSSGKTQLHHMQLGLLFAGWLLSLILCNSHILTIPNDESYQEMVRLAEAIGLQVAAAGLVSKQQEPAALPVLRSVLSEAERQYHLAIIARGGSGKSIPDPLAWQREIRQDRPLPGRD